MDAASKAKLALLYPPVAELGAQAIADAEQATGRLMRVTEGLRPWDAQAQRYALGRTVPGPDVSPDRPMGRTVTNAEPGYSRHQYGLALDACFAGTDPYLEKLPAVESKAAWEAYARAGERVGLFAGLRFGAVDSPHLEMRYARVPLHELRWLFSTGGLVKVWLRLDAFRGVPPGSGWNDAVRKGINLGASK